MKLEDYEIEKFIGKGAFWEVYLTKKEGDSKKYATRKIDRKEIDNNENIKKFISNEIFVLKNLEHPNIIKLYDIKKTKLHYYIIMELCNGGSLSEALKIYKEKNGKAFPEELVQYFMRQIIDAFKYIHGKKMILRNINLDNILLHFDNEEDKKNFNLMKAKIKITDFGFSCFCNTLEASLAENPISIDPFIFTKLNSSPTKKEKIEYNQSFDIWLIGTILYEMLTGKCAFDAEYMEDLLKLFEIGNYTVPNSVSIESISFLNSMLQFEPKNRLTTEQLSEHAFLIKEIKHFSKFNLNLKSHEVKGNEILLNIYRSNQFIDI